MGQLKQLEQQILDEWRRFAESKHDAEEFSEDGLLWRGLIYYADGSWHRREGNEEELWLNAKRRLLILTKDLNEYSCILLSVWSTIYQKPAYVDLRTITYNFRRSTRF